MLAEADDYELKQTLWQTEGPVVVFFHTPLCGTCKVGRKMLDVALAALPDIPAFACNLNAMPHYAQEWQIESIPCLVVVERLKVVEKIYAFQSAGHLFRVLQPYCS
ncbi:thioredoxin family protein [Alicyclobacillus cycloheptanicus]|jgi:thioredoxin-like negative regulator of GroEL|uniref:Thioredoxin-like negative regulator of GroEL n=1 Tax=Alicyclobacillus cycloheptanicus TaxID=1457 RepID=A0ABT9XIF6_9BACL|nr:thioredoxin family protein [Alicyclobacillus cycloheptanicus]MDQ0190091.1 thioredoxin-like negative regulator of GroEL [Alicyclobacillus cycloheptanicus]WDM02066.1 thioredoxin family protein [Alicyclobacillus cycloheptanicus]